MSSAETYYGLIETSEDAIILFEACRLGIRRRVQRRLTDTERMSIRSGSVFVWDEDESGMRRWTDGRSWSPSRVQGCFLTYCEWEGRRRATIRRPNLEVTLLPFGDVATGPPAYVPRYSQPARQSTCQIQQGCAKENGILKKALSLTTTDGRKLHLIAYYYKQDLDIPNRLLTPSTDPKLQQISIPAGIYPPISELHIPMVQDSPASSSPHPYAGMALETPRTCYPTTTDQALVYGRSPPTTGHHHPHHSSFFHRQQQSTDTPYYHHGSAGRHLTPIVTDINDRLDGLGITIPGVSGISGNSHVVSSSPTPPSSSLLPNPRKRTADDHCTHTSLPPPPPPPLPGRRSSTAALSAPYYRDSWPTHSLSSTSLNTPHFGTAPNVRHYGYRTTHGTLSSISRRLVTATPASSIWGHREPHGRESGHVPPHRDGADSNGNINDSDGGKPPTTIRQHEKQQQLQAAKLLPPIKVCRDPPPSHGSVPVDASGIKSADLGGQSGCRDSSPPVHPNSSTGLLAHPSLSLPPLQHAHYLPEPFTAPSTITSFPQSGVNSTPTTANATPLASVTSPRQAYHRPMSLLPPSEPHHQTQQQQQQQQQQVTATKTSLGIDKLIHATTPTHPPSSSISVSRHQLPPPQPHTDGDEFPRLPPISTTVLFCDRNDDDDIDQKMVGSATHTRSRSGATVSSSQSHPPPLVASDGRYPSTALTDHPTTPRRGESFTAIPPTMATALDRSDVDGYDGRDHCPPRYLRHHYPFHGNGGLRSGSGITDSPVHGYQPEIPMTPNTAPCISATVASTATTATTVLTKLCDPTDSNWDKSADNYGTTGTYISKKGFVRLSPINTIRAHAAVPPPPPKSADPRLQQRVYSEDRRQLEAINSSIKLE